MPAINLPGYEGCKSALNGATKALPEEFGSSGFEVNGAATCSAGGDLNGHQVAGHVSQAVAVAVLLAAPPENGSNGGFFDDEGVASR